MLSERITRLFSVLQCNNTQIARFAGCSSGNISKLKTGNRAPKPTSRSIESLVSGVYGYADYENLLSVLAELCGVEKTDRDTLIPALIGWLYDTAEITLPLRAVTPKTKQARVRQRQTFGEKLDRAMTLLELSNGQLAALLNIDGSLVSRYRTGLYSPQGNDRLSERLAAVLLDRAEKKGLLPELERLCGVPSGALDGDCITQWLYEAVEADATELAQRLLRSLDAFTPGQGLPAGPPALPPFETASCYWGTAGLRSAVVRFLSDAAQQGGELLLYSDEPMDWMAGDRDYFALWASLMVACVKNGVKIKIIHNIDRAGPEMIDAIQGWFPLYISGMIEPYVSTRPRNARFCHTVFLHVDHACIHGFFPDGAADRWYDYLTETPKLDALEREYETMLSAASPFLKTYPASMGGDFLRFRMDRKGAHHAGGPAGADALPRRSQPRDKAGGARDLPGHTKAVCRPAGTEQREYDPLPGRRTVPAGQFLPGPGGPFPGLHAGGIRRAYLGGGGACETGTELPPDPAAGGAVLGYSARHAGGRGDGAALPGALRGLRVSEPHADAIGFRLSLHADRTEFGGSKDNDRSVGAPD